MGHGWDCGLVLGPLLTTLGEDRDWSQGGQWEEVGGSLHPAQDSHLFLVFCMPDDSSEEEEEELEEEEEEEEDEDEEGVGSYRLGAGEQALSPSLEESGLGLLARFAASALPSPVVGPPLSVVQLEAEQKARKKEERQSLMGKYHWLQSGCCGPITEIKRLRLGGGWESGWSFDHLTAGKPLGCYLPQKVPMVT